MQISPIPASEHDEGRGSGATVQLSVDFKRDVERVLAMAETEGGTGSNDAFAHQFRHLRAPLVAWFRRRVGDPAEAEDLAQESFLRIANRESDSELEHFESYLYRTAKSVLFDRRRRRSVRQTDAHVSLLPDHDAIDETNALRAVLAKEKLRQVSAVLMTMPERTRSIFILCRLEGLRYAEVATRYGITVGAVQKHMLRAIETMMRTGENEA